MFVLFGCDHAITFPNHGTWCCTFGTAESPDEAMCTFIIHNFQTYEAYTDEFRVIFVFRN